MKNAIAGCLPSEFDCRNAAERADKPRPGRRGSYWARTDRITGTVVLQAVVNEKGQPTEITLLSPLGYGLDERALSAVEKWQFAPGMKNGRPAKILVTVEVNFEAGTAGFNRLAERERTVFNVAIRVLQQPEKSPKEIQARLKDIRDLSSKGYAPAMYTLGLWETTGEHVAKDAPDGLTLMQKAAAKSYGPALMQIGLREIEGRDLPKDAEKGLKDMRQASVFGSPGAQFYLGDRYEKGVGVTMNREKASEYFRLCAARAVSMCQYRLGLLLLNAPDRSERDYVQAVAWLQLAAEQSLPQAKEIAASESGRLTPAQTTSINTLKPQLVRK